MNNLKKVLKLNLKRKKLILKTITITTLELNKKESNHNSDC